MRLLDPSPSRLILGLALLSLLPATTAQTPCSGGMAGGYPCDLVDLMSFTPRSTWGGAIGSDSWGWKDPLTGVEYALMGMRSGTAFFEISDPANPVYLGRLPTQTSSSDWRDIKVYRDHAYIVSEAGSHGVQVFDLTQLRGVVSPPVVFSVTAHYGGVGRAHNMVINEDTGLGAVVGSTSCGGGGPLLLDLTNPASPVFAGCVSADGYTHDAQIVIYKGPDLAYQGRELCICCNEDTVTVFDVTNPSSPVQLARKTYPDGGRPGPGYTHQGWLTEDHAYFILGDELDELNLGHNTRMRVWSMADVTNPTLLFSEYLPTRAIDHNIYVVGGRAYLANYRAGVRVLDLDNLAGGTMPQIGYLDTYPSSDSANFNGIWNVYPFFDSETLLASSIGEGMFLLEPDVSLKQTRCVISAPLGGSTIAGDVTVTWKGWDPQGDPVTSSFDFSSDGGLTWTPLTATAGSPAANPDAGRVAPFFDAALEWDTRADALGAAGAELVLLRVTITDGGNQRECTQIMTVNNLPACAITAPAGSGWLSGELDIVWDGTSPSGDPVTSNILFSTDAGVTFQPVTPAAGSPAANPDLVRPTPFTGATLRWDTPADGVGLVGPQSVELQIQVDSGGPAGSCSQAGLTIHNQPGCFITSPAPGVMIAGDMDITFEGHDPSSDALTSTFEFSTDGGTSWQMATPAPSSALSNPDPARPSPFVGVTFTWDSQGDGVGAMGSQNADFRITVDDGFATGTCNLGVVFIDNGPSCMISAPVPGAPVRGDVTLTYSGDDSSGDPIASSFEFSTDGGTSFLPATPAAGSPTSNPDPARPTPFSGLDFIWNAQVDGVGLTGSQSVTCRIAVDDGVGISTCGVVLAVDNQPACSITSPAPGTMLDDYISITYTGDDPGGDPVTSTLEWSTDGGASWTLATAAPPSPTTNPDPTRPTPFVSAVFVWDSQADAVGVAGAQNALMRITADDTYTSGSCQIDLEIDNQPSCNITFPTPTLMVSADVGINFDGADASGDPITSSFSWSTDGGATFSPCSASPGSPLANPDPARPTPFTGQVFIWDSLADAVGRMMVQTTLLQVSVDEGGASSTCSVAVEVDNVPPPPTCTITLPPGTSMNDVDVLVDASSPSTSIVDIALEYSLDGGATWILCTTAAGSPQTNPALGVPVGQSSFLWDSRGDSVALVVPVMVQMRAVIEDGFSPVPGECQGSLEVDNTSLCSTFCGDCNLNLVGPDVLDSLTAARIAAGLEVPSLFQTGCCDVDSSGTINVIDSLLIAQSAAGLPLMLVCP